jgi:hypothetical protein
MNTVKVNETKTRHKNQDKNQKKDEIEREDNELE